MSKYIQVARVETDKKCKNPDHWTDVILNGRCQRCGIGFKHVLNAPIRPVAKRID